MTDANLLLGRLIPEYFPKIFGKSEKEPLDTNASRREFEKLARDINDNSVNKFSLDEIVYGCVIPPALWEVFVAECGSQVHQGRQRDDVPSYTRID